MARLDHLLGDGPMKRIDIYLASPLTHPVRFVHDCRFQKAAHAAATLKRQGYSVFSPIAHGYPICEQDADHTWAGWSEEDLAIMGLCRCFVTLEIPGWETSHGLIIERGRALDMGLVFGVMRPMTHYQGITLNNLTTAWTVQIPESIIPSYTGLPQNLRPKEEP